MSKDIKFEFKYQQVCNLLILVDLSSHCEYTTYSFMRQPDQSYEM